LSRGLPAEFALMAACCRWPRSAARNAAIVAAASEAIDWGRFERVVARHRVAPLARDGLRHADIAVPSRTAGNLVAAATAATVKALAMARETMRLQQELDELGISNLSVKGSSLAVLAYGALGMKEAWDIDLLIPAKNILEVQRLLEQRGYASSAPMDDAGFERFSQVSKECIFLNPSLGFAVELHWRLTDNPRLVPGIGLHSPSQDVQIGGAHVRTLARDSLFAFLCVHGTMHSWSRFKWLADVAAYIDGNAPAEIERLYRSAVRLGAGRSPAVTFLLCERLLGLAIPAALIAEASADRTSNALADSAFRCMTWRQGAVEFQRRSSPVMRIALSRFFLVPGAPYLWSELGLKWNSPADRARWNFPRSLAILYHFLRIPLWLGRCSKRWLGRT